MLRLGWNRICQLHNLAVRTSDRRVDVCDSSSQGVGMSHPYYPVDNRGKALSMDVWHSIALLEPHQVDWASVLVDVPRVAPDCPGVFTGTVHDNRTIPRSLVFRDAAWRGFAAPLEAAWVNARRAEVALVIRDVPDRQRAAFFDSPLTRNADEIASLACQRERTVVSRKILEDAAGYLLGGIVTLVVRCKRITRRDDCEHEYCSAEIFHHALILHTFFHKRQTYCIGEPSEYPLKNRPLPKWVESVSTGEWFHTRTELLPYTDASSSP